MAKETQIKLTKTRYRLGCLGVTETFLKTHRFHRAGAEEGEAMPSSSLAEREPRGVERGVRNVDFVGKLTREADAHHRGGGDADETFLQGQPRKGRRRPVAPRAGREDHARFWG